MPNNIEALSNQIYLSLHFLNFFSILTFKSVYHSSKVNQTYYNMEICK